jgi:hypothetical protein
MVVRGLNLGMIKEVPEGAEVFLETGGQSLRVVVMQPKCDELAAPVLELAPQLRPMPIFSISDKDLFCQGEARLAKGTFRPVSLGEGLKVSLEMLPAKLPIGSW